MVLLKRVLRSPVGAQVLRRLAWTVPTLVFITLITFIAGDLAPGDPAVRKAGMHGGQEAVELIREKMGLNRPLHVRYAEFVWNAAHFEFGESLVTPRAVNEIVLTGIQHTGRIALLAILLASGVGILLGGIAAIWRNRVADRLAVSFSTLGICIPNFVLAPVLVYIFAIWLDRLPVAWRDDPERGPWIYLILPVAIMALRPAAVITRLTRASMIDTLSQDFIRTAYAKGVPFWRTIIVHALRNSLVPIMTAVGTSLGFLLTGSFIIETAFLIPGLGSASIDAIRKADYPVIQATVLIFAVLFIAVNLLVDLLLPLIDPRIKEGAA
ncbi:MAG: ABC transporter permease [Armatimonadetes bacterium]|nr:ABC transporter permease [Armatimonadota bacterium]